MMYVVIPDTAVTTKRADVVMQTPASAGVDRSNKVAPMPEVEKGEALEGMGASGGGNSGANSGKGAIEATVDKEAQKH
jgi:hypothetical protein